MAMTAADAVLCCLRVVDYACSNFDSAAQAGEALTISYIDLELPRSARQLELKTSFFFDCKCSR